MQKRKFINNIGWLMCGRIVNMLLQFIVSLATARYLGPSNFGTINYVAAFVSFFSSIASLGLAVIVIREISLNHNDKNEIIWTSIILRFVTAVLSAVCVVALMHITHRDDPAITIIAFLESISIIFSAFDTINYYFQGSLQAKWGSIAGVLAYIGMSLYRIYLLTTGANIIWFAFATSTDMIFLTVFLMFFYVRIEGFHIKFNWSLGKEMLRQSYHYLVAGLITILYAQVDRIMLGNMLDSTSVGHYSAALSISQLWSLIPSALIQSLTPVLYQAAEKKRELYLRRLSQSYAVIFWLNVVYSLFVMFFAESLIGLLYGKEYIAAVDTLRVVVWYYGISTMTMLNQVYLANDNKNKYINLFCFAGLMVNVILNYLLIPKYGTVGAAIATLVTHIVIQFVMPYIYQDTREMVQCMIHGAILKNVLVQQDRYKIKMQFGKLWKKLKHTI